jgi:hypothetical protein
LGGCHEGDDLLATWKTDGSYPARWTVAEASLIAQAIPRFCLGTHTIETEMLRLSKVEGRGEGQGEPDAARASQPPQRMEAVA